VGIRVEQLVGCRTQGRAMETSAAMGKGQRHKPWWNRGGDCNSSKRLANSRVLGVC
jgi:hypothetical protein